MVQNESFYPAEVGLFGADTVVFNAQMGADLLKQSGLLSCFSDHVEYPIISLPCLNGYILI